MLFSTALVLLVVWILGVVNGYPLGGLIHILLALAVALFLVTVIRERRAKRDPQRRVNATPPAHIAP
jgi:uncharacterized protein (DUF58 family)